MRKYYCPDILNVKGSKVKEYRDDEDQWDKELESRGLRCETPEEAEAMYDMIMGVLHEVAS